MSGSGLTALAAALVVGAAAQRAAADRAPTEPTFTERACEPATAPPACRAAFERQKITVDIRTERAQDGSPIGTPRFRTADGAVSRKEFARHFEALTGSHEMERLRARDTSGLYYFGLIAGSVGIVAGATGGILVAASKPDSGVRTAGWITVISGLALLAPAPYAVIAGGDPDEAGYALRDVDAAPLVARYNKALWERIGATCSCSATKTSSIDVVRAAAIARPPTARLQLIVGPTSVGVRSRFRARRRARKSHRAPTNGGPRR